MSSGVFIASIGPSAPSSSTRRRIASVRTVLGNRLRVPEEMVVCLLCTFHFGIIVGKQTADKTCA